MNTLSLLRVDLTPTADKVSSKSPCHVIFLHKLTSLFVEETLWIIPRARLPPSPRKLVKQPKIRELSEMAVAACHCTTFLKAWLTIINNYLGLENKMVRLVADFNRRRLMQIRNNCINLLKIGIVAISPLLSPHFNPLIQNLSLRFWEDGQDSY